MLNRGEIVEGYEILRSPLALILLYDDLLQDILIGSLGGVKVKFVVEDFNQKDVRRTLRGVEDYTFSWRNAYDAVMRL